MSGETIVQGISPLRLKRDVAADVILLGFAGLTLFGYASAFAFVWMTIL